MPYRFSRERLDYSDFASGRVFRSLPGRTAFPVRLADELFQRCLAIRRANGGDGPVVLYDPCCGGALLHCTLALLHWPSIRRIVASDADPEAVALAGRNLALLTPEGIARRREEIAALHAAYEKDSHAEALQSADRLAAQLAEHFQLRPLPTRLFLADALDPASLLPHLEPGSVDVVIADVPHGRRTHWRHAQAQAGQEAPDSQSASATIWQLLEALWPFLAPDAVVAVVGDKAQRTRHDRYAPSGTLQIGKRRATFLTRRPAPLVTLVPMSDGEQHAFTEAQIADYAEWMADRGDVPDLEAGLARARSEIESEMAAAVASGDLLWSAQDAAGTTVGWLWVQTSSPSLPPDAAYLYQILVKREARRRGHGLAMLAALEQPLAERGVAEIYLHTENTNLPAQRLYERAGYELVEQLPTQRHLRKRLPRSDSAPG
ncbi:MAG TPA: GNAT family N-acetyltransferase [Chloroflexota bacterium]|nr:GNAT family N-acetyltransferase [Chloroflexota bacterium]